MNQLKLKGRMATENYFSFVSTIIFMSSGTRLKNELGHATKIGNVRFSTSRQYKLQTRFAVNFSHWDQSENRDHLYDGRYSCPLYFLGFSRKPVLETNQKKKL